MEPSSRIGVGWVDLAQARRGGSRQGPALLLPTEPDRFGQSRPKVLVAAVSYQYNDKTFPLIDQINEVVEKVPSIEKVLLVDFLGQGYPENLNDKFRPIITFCNSLF